MAEPVPVIVRPRKPTAPLDPEPDGPLRCARCGSVLSLCQPDPSRPDDLLGCCFNPSCGEWAVVSWKEGRLAIVERIGEDRRRRPPRAGNR